MELSFGAENNPNHRKIRNRHMAILCAALPFLPLIVLGILIARSPHGVEIPGVGFVNLDEYTKKYGKGAAAKVESLGEPTYNR
jgi:hypothetical protein